MAAARFPGIDLLEVARYVGPAALSRGERYAEGGRVLGLQWDAKRSRLGAEVLGTDPQPYRCFVDLELAGRTRILASSCDCPIGWACKHAAAVLIAGNREVAARERAHATSAPGWRRELAALTPQNATDPAERAPIALQFSLREKLGRARQGRWYAQRDEEATGEGTVSALGLRPVTQGRRGGWIKGQLSWDSVGYLGSSTGFDPAVSAWFREFGVLSRARQAGFIPTGSEWLSLDAFASPMLWPMLQETAALGIPLVGTSAAVRIEVADESVIRIDARQNESSLLLAPEVRFDGEPVDARHVRAIGGHGLYRFDFAAGRIVLAPLERPMTPAQRTLLQRSTAVEVPADDVPEFLRLHYRALRRSVAVTSGDDSFRPPAPEPAVLVLGVTVLPRDGIALGWSWRHEGGRESALDAPDDAFDDPQPDRAPAAAVAELLGAAPIAVTLWDVDAADFVARVLPELRGIDRVAVEVAGVLPDYRQLTEPPKLTVSTVDTGDNDWFDLGVILTVEGRKIPFGPLFTALSQGATKLKLVDGSYFSLNHPVFQPLRQLIEEAGTLDEWETGVRVSRYQSTLVSEFEDLADESEGAVRWREAVAGIGADAAPSLVDTPASFAGELRPYQQDGLSWLAFLQANRLGGILADDMGLGKTAQTLAMIARTVQQDATAPFLVVAPTSVVSNWASEAGRFTPDLRVAVLGSTQAKGKHSIADVAAQADIVITSYAILRLDSDTFAALDWAGLVLDEAQFVKNAASKAHQAARGIRAPFRLAVTGTPIENNLTELWALFQIVAPGLFPSRRAFAERYARPIENDGNSERLATLRRRIRPFLLRRTKEQVAPELPAKQEQVLRMPLEPRHRRIYDATLQRERQKLLGLIDDLDRNRFIVFRSLTLLRLLSLDAALVDAERYAGVPSSKLDALFEQLDDVLAEGHRALVFSQFTSFLARAADRLAAAGVPFAYLDGSTTNRGEVIEAFRSGDAPVFLISLKAGGFGLNLTEADYVFLLDPWWNPATEEQAIDRTHRIGQDKTVMVYRLVAEDTIEEKVMALKARKAELTASVLDEGEAFSSALTADDIRELLG